MPKVFEWEGFKFYIYTDDHLPVHIHIFKGGAEAKIIIAPEILIKDNYGFKSKELKQILFIIESNYEFLMEKWNEIHSK